MNIHIHTRKFLITALATSALNLPAFAADVETTAAQKNGWISYQSELDRTVAAVNADCQSKLVASYDKSTYASFDPLTDRTQSACQAAVGTLSAICASEAGAKAVRALSASSCQFSTSGTGVSRTDQTLIIRIDPQRSEITGKQKGGYSWASALKEVL